MINCMGEILPKTNGIFCFIFKRTYLCYKKKMSLKVDFKPAKHNSVQKHEIIFMFSICTVVSGNTVSWEKPLHWVKNIMRNFILRCFMESRRKMCEWGMYCSLYWRANESISWRPKTINWLFVLTSLNKFDYKTCMNYDFVMVSMADNTQKGIFKTDHQISHSCSLFKFMLWNEL